MYKECKTDRSLQRRILIEECLITQMQKKDYEQIHISDICALTGVSRTVFYRYFDTKIDVLEAYLDRLMKSFSDARWYTQSSGDLLKDGMFHFIRYWYENRVIFGLLFEQNMSDLIIKKAVQIGSQQTKNIQRIVMNKDEASVHRATVFSAYGIIGLMYDWQKRGFIESEDELADNMIQLLLQPLYHIDEL